MKTTADEPGVVVSIRVPAEQRLELERRAREDRRPLSFLVREAIADYLERAADNEGEAA